MYHKSFAAIRIYLPEIIIEKIRTLFKGQSYDLRFKFSNLFMFSMINRTCETSCFYKKKKKKALSCFVNVSFLCLYW